MASSPQPPTARRAHVADLVLTCAGVALGLLTLSLQRAVDDAAWRAGSQYLQGDALLAQLVKGGEHSAHAAFAQGLLELEPVC